jgi:hypothetical protein
MFVRTVAAGSEGGHVAQLDVQVARGPLPRVMVRHGDPAPEVTIAFARVKQGQAIGRPLLLVRLDRAGAGIARGNLLATLTDEGGRSHRVGAALTADAGAGPQTIEMPLLLPGGVAPDNAQLTLAYLPQGERSPAFTATVALR